MNLCRFLNIPSISFLIQKHRSENLPSNVYDRVRIIVRRRHILPDTLHQLRFGLDVSKHMRVTFIGEPVVDAGGPMREYLHILMSSVARDNSLFCGEDTRRVPVHSVVELEKQTFIHVGSIFALSLIHGGPSPNFLAPPVADYIVHGVQPVEASAEDVPVKEMREKILKVKFIIVKQSIQCCSAWGYKYT